ncbi:MAG: Stp1/IreP family PP2C-type Ser/Thr phosphatase [Lachnospiraceae bacterium]|nr:Stp1/IreP family PP2C-type Ser/Thr phosphatase [Lachnospiraceae bacterium]
MKAYAKTDVGKKRTMNQDFLFCSTEAVGSFQNLFIVADGMGGHKAGDHASKLCVEEVVKTIRDSEHKTPITIYTQAVDTANSRVYEEAEEYIEYEGMGTTFVSCTIDRGTMYAANIGDSRLYLLRGHIEQITEDHSLVYELVKNGRITESEARFHPQKNIITRALGTDEEVSADYYEKKLEVGDIVLLCSDGLSNMLDNEEMEYVLKHSKNIEAATETLVDKANKNGGEDNISVIVIKIENEDISDFEG